MSRVGAYVAWYAAAADRGDGGHAPTELRNAAVQELIEGAKARGLTLTRWDAERALKTKLDSDLAAHDLRKMEIAQLVLEESPGPLPKMPNERQGAKIRAISTAAQEMVEGREAKWTYSGIHGRTGVDTKTIRSYQLKGWLPFLDKQSSGDD